MYIWDTWLKYTLNFKCHQDYTAAQTRRGTQRERGSLHMGLTISVPCDAQSGRCWNKVRGRISGSKVFSIPCNANPHFEESTSPYRTNSRRIGAYRSPFPKYSQVDRPGSVGREHFPTYLDKLAEFEDFGAVHPLLVSCHEVELISQ